MSSIFTINSNILDCFDIETGEILEGKEKELADLQVEKEVKLENIALVIKQLNAESEAIKSEEAVLKQRRQVKENTIEYLKNLLSINLKGEKFETGKVRISWRKSESVEVNEAVFFADKNNEQYIKVKVEKSADKTMIKSDIKNGCIIEGAELITKNNIQIK